MATYIAAPSTTANNSNQKTAQSTAGAVNVLANPVIVALSTTDNTTNQKTAQSMISINPTSPLGRGVDAAPRPTAVNLGGGQFGYGG